MNKQFFFCTLSLCCLLLVLGGCDEDNGPVIEYGSIAVTSLPDSLSATWEIVGPGKSTYSGAGDTTLTEIVVGDYTITWDDIVGWSTPTANPETKALTKDATITFSGVYGPSTVIIDPNPNTLNVAWELSGPEAYMLAGEGDLVLQAMPTGDYTLTWSDVEGYLPPTTNPVTATLAVGDSITFAHTFVVEPVPVGQVTIAVVPTDITAEWTLTGPEKVSYTGSGDSTLVDMGLGNYTVAWGDLDGWFTPDPTSESGTLAEDEELVFTGTYLQHTGSIVVDVDPDGADATWNLEGPGEYSHIGTGDETLVDLIYGQYTITWNDVENWISPDPNTETIEIESLEAVTLTGTYLIIPSTMSSFLPGQFLMGSPEIEEERKENEAQHWVSLTNAFLVSQFEVTNQQYLDLAQWALAEGHITATATSVSDNLDGSTVELLNLDGDFYGTPTCQIVYTAGTFGLREEDYADLPVVEVTWYGAVAYCDWLSLQEGLPRAHDHSDWSFTGGDLYATSGYRLMTESEWEYACRAGTTTPFNSGDCLDTTDDANFRGAASSYGSCPIGINRPGTIAAGYFTANAGGLFSMHGNVAEWCSDWFDEDYPTGTEENPVVDPVGPAGPLSLRVNRGGSFYSTMQDCRSAARESTAPEGSSQFVGFRIAKNAN